MVLTYKWLYIVTGCGGTLLAQGVVAPYEYSMCNIGSGRRQQL